MYVIFNTELNTAERSTISYTGKVFPAFGCFLFDNVINFDIHSINPVFYHSRFLE